MNRNPTEGLNIPDIVQADPPLVINENQWPSYGLTWSSNIAWNETGSPLVVIPIGVVAGAFSITYKSDEPELDVNVPFDIVSDPPNVSTVPVVINPNINLFLGTMLCQKDLGLKTIRDMRNYCEMYLDGKVEISPAGIFSWLSQSQWRDGSNRRYSKLCRVLRNVCYMLEKSHSFTEVAIQSMQQFIVGDHQEGATSSRTKLMPIKYQDVEYSIQQGTLLSWAMSNYWAAALTNRVQTLPVTKMLDLWWNIYSTFNGARIYRKVASLKETLFEGVMPNDDIYLSQISPSEYLTKQSLSPLNAMALPLFLIYWDILS